MFNLRLNDTLSVSISEGGVCLLVLRRGKLQTQKAFSPGTTDEPQKTLADLVRVMVSELDKTQSELEKSRS